jgi:hypothetical protein
MVRLKDKFPTCLSLGEVAMIAVHKVLMDNDDNSLKAFSYLQGILGQQLRFNSAV